MSCPVASDVMLTISGFRLSWVEPVRFQFHMPGPSFDSFVLLNLHVGW
jgi:hypothetical protein